MSIFDVQHQSRAHRIIQRALACARMPHAYLFAGPEGVGKETLANQLAKMLLCTSPVRCRLPTDLVGATEDGEGWEACGQCQDCQLVEADTHPDLFLIHRQLNKQHPDSVIRKQKALTLSVEVVRHFLIDHVGTFPSRGRAKVFIVREAERLNEAAQNSLLKTLEEPPENTFIILLTNAMDRMLPTTRSRCQQVSFQSLPADFVEDRLQAMRSDREPQEIAYMARHAEGSLGLALQQIDDGLYALKGKWGDRLMELVADEAGFAPNSLAKPFQADAKVLGKAVLDRDPEVSETDATRVGLQMLLAALADFHTDALRKVSAADLPMINMDQEEVVGKLVGLQNPRALLSALRQIALAETNIGRNANIELTLETLFIQLAKCY